MSTGIAAPPADADALTELLESSWSARARRLPRRELGFELALTLALVGACVALAHVTGTGLAPDLVALPTALAYLLASRVAYPLGAGNIVPTQPLLVALFAVAPPAAVPLLVCAAFAVGRLFDAARGRVHMERVTFAGGNAWHAAGPAMVLALSGASSIEGVAIPLLVLAMVAQVVFDLGFSTVREWVASGVRPRLQARVSAQIAAVDLALAPLGLLAAFAASRYPWSPLALLPLVIIFGLATRDRRAAVERAHDQLVTLDRERTRLRSAVRRVGEAFASTLDIDALLDIVTRAAVEALDAEAGRAETRDVGEAGLQVRTTVGEAAQAPVLAAASAAAALAPDGLGEAVDGELHGLAGRVMAGDTPIGTVALVRRGHPFGDEGRSLLAYLCDQAGVAAGNALRHEHLHHQALTDELTGLANHRRFQEVLGAAVERYARDDTGAALLLFDLDRFKAINDGHGHQTGDLVLEAVGRCLRDSCRDADVPARYGGEELAVVAAGAGLEDALLLAERIRAGVAALRVRTPDGTPLQITVSAGVAVFGPGRRTKADLIAAADAALYEAKRGGRDRVVAAD